MKDLGSRALFGGIGVAILVCMLIFLQTWWMEPLVGIAIAAVASLALVEYYGLAKIKGYLPPTVWGVVLTIAYIALNYFQLLQFRTAALIAIVLLLFIRQFWNRTRAIATLAVSVFGIFYIVFPLSLLIDILYGFPARIGSSGAWWFIFLVVVTVVTDMAAYFVGNTLGKHPLSPALSPSKTVEGAIGGVVGGVIAAVLLGLATDEIALWQSLVLGFILTIAGQVGDIGESLLKRDAEVKDSSNIPGLGGVLDVVDSLLFNIPVVYVTLNLLYGASS